MVSKSWIKRLLEEMKQWAVEGLITPEQQARISSRYSGRLEYSRLTNTVITLGSILVGLGILLFVASNWDKLGRPEKISIIFAVISLFHLSGYYFRYVRSNHPGLGEGFQLIGAFAFGAGIWLVAQMYNIHYNFSAGILFWILGILPLVFVFRSWMILALASVLSLIWISSYIGYYFQREAYGFFLLLPVFVGLCYFLKQRFSLFVAIVSLAVWLTHFWLLKYVDANSSSGNNALTAQLSLTTLYSALGFILYRLGLWHERANTFTIFSFFYKVLGMLFITLPVYSLTFSHHYPSGASSGFPSSIVYLTGIALIVSTGTFFILRRPVENDALGRETKSILYFYALQLIALVFSFSWPITSSLAYNILLIVETLGFIYLGFLRHNIGIFRLAIAIFFLNALSRYFDIFWEMMSRSLLFILGGLLLIVLSIIVNRNRKYLEEKMKQGAAR